MTQDPLLAGVIGWPIGHSRSPRIHGHWCRRYGIAGHYIPVAVAPENLASALSALACLGFKGVNVTIPHKEAVLSLASEVTEIAGKIGAANTLTFRNDGSFRADNTDAYGFRQNVRQAFPDWRPETGAALVLGAGGASRAVVQSLLDDGVPEIRIANRSRDRAEALRHHFGARVASLPWDEAAEHAQDAVTIVNTTALGMAGQAPLVLDLSKARIEAVVTDIVYEPLRTPFLEAAERQGFRTVDGLGMLLHQAAPGFRTWFGTDPLVDGDLRRAVLG
jgi:shikimate dehydrogenase